MSWTSMELRTVRQYYLRKMGSRQIAERMGKTHEQIRYAIRQHIIPKIERESDAPAPVKINRDGNINEDFRNYACEYCGLDLTTKHRNRATVQMRNMAMYWMRLNLQISLKDIGVLFGDRHHSTVIHSLQTHKTDLQYKYYKAKYRRFKKFIDARLTKYPGDQKDVYLIEVSTNQARQKARELAEAGGLSDFVQHQLMIL